LHSDIVSPHLLNQGIWNVTPNLAASQTQVMKSVMYKVKPKRIGRLCNFYLEQ